jgi:dTDP-4-dehydrorhamnose 3,5-epimerase-like enzyme
MIEGVRIDRLEIKRDERGWLTEILHSSNQSADAKLAQLYITVGNPGKTKGKHYTPERSNGSRS